VTNKSRKSLHAEIAEKAEEKPRKTTTDSSMLESVRISWSMTITMIPAISGIPAVPVFSVLKAFSVPSGSAKLAAHGRDE